MSRSTIRNTSAEKNYSITSKEFIDKYDPNGKKMRQRETKKTENRAMIQNVINSNFSGENKNTNYNSEAK